MSIPNTMLLAAVIAVILAGLSLWLTYALVRWVARMILGTSKEGSGHGQVIDAEPRIRLLGLAIACLLFAPLISRLIRASATLLTLLAERLSLAAMTSWRQQAELCELSSRAECMQLTTLGLLQAAGGALGSAARDSGLAQVQFGYLLFFLALWVLAAELLETLMEPGKDDKRRLDLKDLLLSRKHWITRQNLLFFVILFVGTYLSLASIAAIPDLSEAEEGGPVAQSFDKVNDKLKGSGITVSKAPANPLSQVHMVLYPTDTATARAAASGANANADTAPGPDTTRNGGTGAAGGAATGAGGSAQGQTQSTAQGGTAGQTQQPTQTQQTQQPPTQTPPATSGVNLRLATKTVQPPDTSEPVRWTITVPDPQQQAVRRAHALLNDFWTDQAVRHDSLSRTLQRRLAHARNMAASAYGTADSTHRVREQRSHSERLQRWLVLTTDDLQREADDATAALQRTERRLQAWSAAAASYLTGPAGDTARLHELTRGAAKLRYDEVLALRTSTVATRPLPERGKGLGVFQWVSGWLLQTDSLPLTMIVGMLGFGLLGAAASTFVREQKKRDQEEEEFRKEQARTGHRPPPPTEEEAASMEKPAQPLVLNLPSVVIRGGSAAIVVFLGIMGGLSVFSSEADPNPYALLFTCLVGAVFSEQVWEWAEKRFGMGGEGGDGKGKGGGKGDGDGGGDDDGGGRGGGRGANDPAAGDAAGRRPPADAADAAARDAARAADQAARDAARAAGEAARGAAADPLRHPAGERADIDVAPPESR